MMEHPLWEAVKPIIAPVLSKGWNSRDQASRNWVPPAGKKTLEAKGHAGRARVGSIHYAPVAARRHSNGPQPDSADYAFPA